MTDEPLRRGVLRGLVLLGTAGASGCNFDNLSGSDGGDVGATSGRTPTPEPLTWPEATRQVLGESDLEVLRGTDWAPGRIGSRSDAERAFTVVGWHRSLRDLDAGERRQMDELLEQGSQVERQISEVTSSLREVESLIGRMKDTAIPLTGQTVWDAAVALSPSLQGFDTAVSEVLDELRIWQRLLGDVTATVTTTRETVAAVRSGSVGRATDLGPQTGRAVSAIEDLESRSSDLEGTLSEYATVTGQVADVAGELGPLSGEIGRVYGEASRQLDAAASDLREFNDLLGGTRSTLSEMRSNARETASRLLARAEELVGPGATSAGSSGGEATPMPADPTTPTDTPPGNPRSDPEFHEGFEDGPGDWQGDTGALEQATDAARGSRAVRIGSGNIHLELTIPETSRETYSLWWKVSTQSAGLAVTFDAGGRALFGMELREGVDGPELVVNQESAAASDLLYARVRTDTWYNLTFTDVDFGRAEFEAALFDAGDLELTRTRQSFAGDGDAVSGLSVERTGDGPVFLDDVRVA